MKKLMVLLVLLLLVSSQVYAYRSLRVSVEQKDGWGWWNNGQYDTDDLTIVWGPTDENIDSVVVTITPFGEPLFRDKGLYVVESNSSAGDTSVSMHLPEGVWLYARLFVESNGDWEAGPSTSFWVKPLGWNGFPIFGSYFCNEFTNSKIDTLNNYPILIADIKSMGQDSNKRDVSNSIRTTCGTKTLRIAHDYVQSLNTGNIFDNTVLDSCKVWYKDDFNPYYFADTTSLGEALPDDEDISEDVDVYNPLVFDPWGLGAYKDSIWCYAAIQNSMNDPNPLEIVAVMDVDTTSNTVTLVRGEGRTSKRTWDSGDVIRVMKYQKPTLGYNSAIPPDLTVDRETLRDGKYFEEWFNDILWDIIDSTKVDSNYWLDAYQNDTFFERNQSEHVSVDAMDDMVADFVNGDFGYDFGFMSNTRVNENTHFARMDSFATMGMYEETNVKKRFDNDAHQDIFEEAFSYSQYRHTKAVLYGTNQVPHFMVLDNDQDSLNTDEDVDDRRRLMAYATVRGMIYLKKKDAVYGVWNGERCVDEFEDAKWPEDTASDSDYYGWLGAPIEDCQLIVNTPDSINIVQDNLFNDEFDDWEITNGTIELTGIEPQEGDSCALIHSTSTSGFGGSVLSQDIDYNEGLSSDKYSTLSFWVRADKPRLIDVNVKCGSSPAHTLASGKRFCPSAYWQRWLFRFKGDGDEDVRVEFHVGNGYEPDNDTVDVYLDNVALYNEDIWVGYSRKFENGMVLYQHTDSDQVMSAWPALKKIRDPNPATYAWADTLHNSGGGYIPTVFTVPTDDDSLGGAYFLSGSPVLNFAEKCAIEEEEEVVYITDRAGDEYENDRTLDSYVSAKTGETATNFGDATELMLVNSPASQRRFAYFKFDIGSLVPDTATVSCAKLFFVISDAVGENLNDTLVLYNVVDDWVEDEITWNIPETGESWTGYHGLGSVQDSVFIDGTLFQEYALDVKDLVEDVLDGNGVPDGWLNVAVGDLAGGTVSHWVASREALPWYRPMLMITYLEE